MRETVLKRALALLTTLKASYIIEVDGHRYSEGGLEKELSQQLYQKRDGALSRYIAKHIDHLKPGDVVVIPVGEFGHRRLQSAAGSRAIAMWGTNSCATERKAKDEHGNYAEIHLMRLSTVQVEKK